MTEALPLVLAGMLGLQSGLVASSRYYRAQRNEQAALNRQHERERIWLENEVARWEQRWLEDQLWLEDRGQHYY